MTAEVKKMHMARWVAVLFLLAAFALGSFAGVLISARKSAAASGAGPIFQVAAGKPLADGGAFAAGFRSVVKKTLPAVVNIASTRTLRTSEEASPFFDPFFRDFFEGPFGFRFEIPRERREQGLGSGVIVTADGYIVTNNHVVSGANEIRVSLADKREFKAKLVGADAKTDIAVLKIEGKDLPFLTLGDSSKLEVGDIVLAMGNPFGIGQTVTLGIVSAVARHGVLDPESYEDFIQTDAAINPGNSGGALVNVSGELVGINTAILSRSGGNQGIGFAIPSNMARHVMQQIIKDGRVVRGWLGVVIQPVDASIAKAFGLKEVRGVLVGDVSPDGPAAKILEKGDVILAFNGEPVANVADLRWKVASTAPKTRVTLRIYREQKEMDVQVTLGELPEDRQRAAVPGGGQEPLEGVQTQDLTPQLARQLGLPRDAFGVVVTSVQPGTPAAEAGLRRGDVIMEVNRRRVANTSAFERAIREAGRSPVVLLVNRSGNTMFIVVEPR